MEEGINEQLNLLQNKYLEFSRIYDQIKDFHSTLARMSPKEYFNAKNEMYKYININYK